MKFGSPIHYLRQRTALWLRTDRGLHSRNAVFALHGSRVKTSSKETSLTALTPEKMTGSGYLQQQIGRSTLFPSTLLRMGLDSRSETATGSLDWT